MVESLLVFAAVALLAAGAWLVPLIPPDALLGAGGWITAAGLLLGVPTGFWYHVALFRALRPRGPLPARWWLHPVPLHARLRETDRPGVLRWFLAGGLGFLVVVVGCVVIVLGLARIWLAPLG